MTSSRPAGGPSRERWHAAGVRHAVLLRALPALRHDVAAPISVLQMTTSLLQRKLVRDPFDADYCAQRVAVFDQQIDALTDALRWLFDWGIGVPDTPVTRTELVQRCTGLLQPLWALEGVAIEVDPLLHPLARAGTESQARPRAGDLIWPRQAALRYLVLAALCYMHDQYDDLIAIRVVPDRHDALQLHGVHRPGGESAALPSSCLAESQQIPVCIDAAALACLAADLGYLVRFNQDGVWLQLADRRNKGAHEGSNQGANGSAAQSATR